MPTEPILDDVRHRILHLSDPHLTAGGFDANGVDAAASLDQILDDARFVPGIDVVVVSGDIADDGSAAGCRAVLERVGRFAADRGIPHIYSTGNHDRWPGFTAALGSGHRDAGGEDVGRLAGSVGDERAAVSEVRGLRVITLDSLVPDSVHGLVSAAQLAWLRATLAEPAPAGSVVVLHHPPIHLDSARSHAIVLQNPFDLGAALTGSDVRAVLTGHLHHQLSGSLNGVPAWVTPGIVTRADLTTPPHLVRAVKGAGATVVDLGGPFSPRFHVLQARDRQAGEPVYLVDTATWTPVEEEQ